MNRTVNRRAATLAFALTLTFAQAAGAQSPAAPPASEPAAAAPARAKVACNECGVVRSVKLVEKKGSSSGVGAVAGGVLGGLLGHQIGSGRGNTAATIVGAGAGAYAGNEVEKNKKKQTYWSVVGQDGQRHDAQLHVQQQAGVSRRRSSEDVRGWTTVGVDHELTAHYVDKPRTLYRRGLASAPARPCAAAPSRVRLSTPSSAGRSVPDWGCRAGWNASRRTGRCNGLRGRCRRRNRAAPGPPLGAARA